MLNYVWSIDEKSILMRISCVFDALITVNAKNWLIKVRSCCFMKISKLLRFPWRKFMNIDHFQCCILAVNKINNLLVKTVKTNYNFWIFTLGYLFTFFVLSIYRYKQRTFKTQWYFLFVNNYKHSISFPSKWYICSFNRNNFFSQSLFIFYLLWSLKSYSQNSSSPKRISSWTFSS